MARTGRILVGASGWVYPWWRGTFYPADLPTTRWLAHYVERFRTVEINRSFYRLPTAAAVRAWREAAPAGFTYAVKASRFITHMKKLKDAREFVPRFLDVVAPLGPRLGPVLFQRLPRWRLDLARLDDFLASLPDGEAPADALALAMLLARA